MDTKWCFVVILFIGLMGSLASGGLLVRNEAGLNLWGYGEDRWEGFSSYIDGAFGGSEHVTAVDSLPDQSSVLAYDALMINQCYGGANPLSGQESAAIQAFMATGKPVLLVGEANNWTDWNEPLLELVGGTYAGTEVQDVTLSPVLTHALTDGVTSVHIAYGGQAEASASSESLFGQEIATLWGPQQNVLVLLDVNVVNDLALDEQDNRVFAQNIAYWLDPAPEPTSLAILSLGAVGLITRKRKA